MGNHIIIQREQKNVLGRGDFSTVWRGFDTRNNETVAVKQMKRRYFTEIFRVRVRVLRELNIMQECRHQNIIQLLDFTMDDRSLYIITELCDANLDEFVKDEDINLPTCFEYMADICAGVEYLHGKDIGHRDLKPQKVLVKDHVLKVTGFGSSRELTDSSEWEIATGLVGSVPWMAPDVYTGYMRPKYSLPVDIFGLALLFLSLLTHRPGEHLTPHTGMHNACDNF